ncbi:MAG: DUF4476 domain-containing protein [Bacteroidota bacterium]
MKRVLILVFFIAVFALQTIAQQASVTVFSKEGEKFWVIVNGIKQNAIAQTNVKVTGLEAPNYKVKVIFEDEKLASVDKTVYTKDADGKFWDITYIIQKNRKGVYVMNMSSAGEATTPTGQFSTQLTLTDAQTPTTQPAGNNDNRNGTKTQTQTTTTTVDGTQNTGGNGGISINIVDPATGDNMSIGTGIGANGTQTKTTTTVTTTTTGGAAQTQTQTQNQTQPQNQTRQTEPVKADHYVMPGYNGKIGCAWPMAGTDFDAAKKSITSKTFEDSKLTVAKQIVGANCITAAQVKEVMLLFSFEDTRLQFAKFAYPYTYDQGNYFKVNDAFSFESTIDELNEFLNTQKR